MGNGEGAQRVCLRTADLGSMEGRREWADTIGARSTAIWAWTGRIAWIDLEAEWSGHAFGDLHISSIQCQQHGGWSPEMVRGDPTAGFLVCMVTSGTVEIEQRDRTNVLSPGAFTPLHLGTPFVFRTPRPSLRWRFESRRLRLCRACPSASSRGRSGAAFNSAGPSAVVGRLIADSAGPDDDVPGSRSASPSAAATMDMLAASVLEAVVDTGAAAGLPDS